MRNNLVIVESPAKAKTIQKFLGKNYVVQSSYGHIRDLIDKSFENELTKKYRPTYVVMPDKENIVQGLKKNAETAETVWLATDEDREGEAIAWHLADELKLKPEKTRRIAFHEITKTAIEKAIETPRSINMNLVDSQQARRVLDKVVGFELSPILWKKIKGNLSAGRVQSVTVRLVVEREREIQNFTSVSSYRVAAQFITKDGKTFKAELIKNLPEKEEALKFLEICKSAEFKIENIAKTDGRRTPAAPFTTSTLQQEAARKLGFSVSQTMRVAQMLYEAGKITYMRTDSVNLSDMALNTAKTEIISQSGEKYYKHRQYKTKTKGAQEAHEAIRPTFLNQKEISGSAQEQRLYELIWKRTIASQMADALLEKTNITISLSNSKEQFIASGEVIKFDGFLKVYMEGKDDENDEEKESLLPFLEAGQTVYREEITATQTFTKHPFRYSEASLVKKLEELGIGRPSTYATTISTIQQRGYVEKKDVAEQKQQTNIIKLKKDVIEDMIKASKEIADKGKLVPADIGFVVNDFLIENFPTILDYNFTANIEQEFDEIAEGKMAWLDEILAFYERFHPVVEKVKNNRADKKVGERLLGTDPKTKKPVYVKIGRFGAMVQMGDINTESGEKPVFASLQSGQSIETLTLNEALELFKLPVNLGKYEGEDVIVAVGRFGAYLKFGTTNISLPKGQNPLEITLESAIELIKMPKLPKNIGKFEGEELVVAVGRFGPYIKFGSTFVSVPKSENPLEITLQRASEIIAAKRNADKSKEIKIFEQDGIKILNGRFGAYITSAGKNYKLSKGTDAQTLTLEQCKEIIASQPDKPAAKKRFRKK
ncbi:MAG: type I DNA topoisomerase [Prevotellaceae bacterium]|jgi:DNA topoisomerase-1|nr:type I DNA topoisomerase [Prevotellaceae bacterium]